MKGCVKKPDYLNIELDTYLFEGVSVVCYIAEIFNIRRSDLFIFPVSSNCKKISIGSYNLEDTSEIRRRH